jgi:hypothetical protein
LCAWNAPLPLGCCLVNIHAFVRSAPGPCKAKAKGLFVLWTELPSSALRRAPSTVPLPRSVVASALEYRRESAARSIDVEGTARRIESVFLKLTEKLGKNTLWMNVTDSLRNLRELTYRIQRRHPCFKQRVRVRVRTRVMVGTSEGGT